MTESIAAYDKVTVYFTAAKNHQGKARQGKGSRAFDEERSIFLVVFCIVKHL